MSDFMSEIKKYPTCEIIKELSYLSILMFNRMESKILLRLQDTKYGFLRCADIMLLAWDIPDIEFLSVINSNDYRNPRKELQIPALVNDYRRYSNQHSTSFKNIDTNTVFRNILGMTSEQFIYQEHWRLFETFNRNYHILVASNGYKHRDNLDINAITQEIFGLSANDYIAVLLTVFWLCSQHPDPLDAPESLYRKNDTTILTKHNITKFVDYYSCTYEKLRDHALGKQLLYSKPFIKTSAHGTILSSSMFLVEMLIGNGIYWLARDCYNNQNSRFFVNTFGELFEDYIEEIATTYCEEGEWEKLRTGKEKSADYIFDFGNLQMLIECKTSLLSLDSKQQVPNIDKVNKFFDHTIKESYEQLNSSYSKFVPFSDVPIIKVILLYDEFSNTGIIEKSISEIFDKDYLCYVMTIREFEIVLYTHKFFPKNREELVVQILKNENCKQKKSFGAILEELSLCENLHIQRGMDYLSKQLDYFGYQLQND